MARKKDWQFKDHCNILYLSLHICSFMYLWLWRTFLFSDNLWEIFLLVCLSISGNHSLVIIKEPLGGSCLSLLNPTCVSWETDCSVLNLSERRPGGSHLAPRDHLPAASGGSPRGHSAALQPPLHTQREMDRRWHHAIHTVGVIHPLRIKSKLNKSSWMSLSFLH